MIHFRTVFPISISCTNFDAANGRVRCGHHPRGALREMPHFHSAALLLGIWRNHAEQGTTRSPGQAGTHLPLCRAHPLTARRTRPLPQSSTPTATAAVSPPVLPLPPTKPATKNTAHQPASQNPTRNPPNSPCPLADRTIGARLQPIRPPIPSFSGRGAGSSPEKSAL
jgi:hypothetical protein